MFVFLSIVCVLGSMWRIWGALPFLPVKSLSFLPLYTSHIRIMIITVAIRRRRSSTLMKTLIRTVDGSCLVSVKSAFLCLICLTIGRSLAVWRRAAALLAHSSTRQLTIHCPLNAHTTQTSSTPARGMTWAGASRCRYARLFGW